MRGNQGADRAAIAAASVLLAVVRGAAGAGRAARKDAAAR